LKEVEEGKVRRHQGKRRKKESAGHVKTKVGGGQFPGAPRKKGERCSSSSRKEERRVSTYSRSLFFFEGRKKKRGGGERRSHYYFDI